MMEEDLDEGVFIDVQTGLTDRATNQTYYTNFLLPCNHCILDRQTLLMIVFCPLGGEMMSEEAEEQGFVVRDKRGRSAPEEPFVPKTEPPVKTESGGSSTSTESSPPAPPLSFSSFVFSLGTSSLMLMGESFDPEQPAPPVNLPQAKDIIDILSMLEEKTKGNLSSEEASVLGDMLYTLRMKYVSATSGVPSKS